MTDREALAAALDDLDDYVAHGQVELGEGGELVVAAARERLAQLPEKCGICWGEYTPCDHCHSTGKVYPAELVERIASAIGDYDWNEPGVRIGWTRLTVAVLDALNETP